MADSAFNYEIEPFITPIRGLYKEYITSVEDLHAKSPQLFENNVVNTASVCDGQLIYELYGNGEEGEIMKEQVQTWICDNWQDVTRAVGTTLRVKEISFGGWFRSSEENKSPDELIVYCLSKMTQKHTVILNKSFAWNTLRNYMSYNDLEIVQRSSVVLIYVGQSKYAVLKPSWTVKTPEVPVFLKTPSKSRKRKAPVKTTCRSSGKHTKTKTSTPVVPTSGTQPVRHTRSLSEKRLNQYGIGGGEVTSARITRKKHVDYLKLNDGLREPDDESISPKPKKKRSYLPSCSGPSSTRQCAQTTVTSPPSRILPCIPAKKTKHHSGAGQTLTNQPTTSGIQNGSGNGSTVLPVTELSTDPVSGVQPIDIENAKTSAASQTPPSASFSGVQSTVYGIQHNATTSANAPTGVQTSLFDPVSGVHAASSVTEHAEICAPSASIPDVTINDEKLPDLVRTGHTEEDNYSLVLDTVPPVGDHSPDNIFDGGTTEEEFDAVDALLSLSTVRDNATESSLDDNASLMPIGGNSIYQDVNPVAVHLDQVSVDGAIAKIVLEESITELVDNVETEKEPLTNDEPDVGQFDTTEQVEAEQPESNNAPVSGVQNNAETEKEPHTNEEPDVGYADATEQAEAEQPESNNAPVSGVQNTLSGVQTAPSGVQNDNITRKNDEPPAEDKEGSGSVTQSKGYVKVTTYGIRRNTNSDNRSYCCSVCGIRKRSAHNLNVHHRKRHSAQMCGVCGKCFDLASSLNHHMYSHNERRFFCEKCSFHCHFKSELTKHNINHHSQPSHQCMKRNCGRWFKRKADLVLHVESHKKDVLECDACDFTTTLKKYLKEHKKSHENTLPYSCNICGKRFLWRSGVRAHKIKEHSA